MRPRLSRHVTAARLYFGAVLALTLAFGVVYWQAERVQAANCAPVVCVPFPSLPAPSGFATPQPGAFATPRPSATPSPSAAPSPGVGQPPVPGAQIPGQDVGLTALAQGALNGAAGLSKPLNDLVNGPNASGTWFLPIYNKMTTIGVWVLLIALLFAVLQYLVARRFGTVASAWFGWAPASVGITATAIAATNLLLAITDGLCAYMLQGLDLVGFLTHLGAALGLVAGGAGLVGGLPFVGAILGGLLVVILLGLIVELLMRHIVLYIALAWLPLTASASAWTGARSWLFRLAALEVSVIFAKFAVVVCLAIGVAAFAANPRLMGSIGDPALVTMLMGLIVLVIALVSPLVLLRILPHQFEHALQHYGNSARRRVGRVSRKWGAARIGQRFGTGLAGKSGVPIASKVAKLGAGSRIIPLSLVVSGGKVVAARGGKVLNTAGKAQHASERPSGRKAGAGQPREPGRGERPSAKPASRQPVPSGRVVPGRISSGQAPSPPPNSTPGPTRPIPKSSPPPGSNGGLPPPPSRRRP